jgi:hypothetical protein
MNCRSSSDWIRKGRRKLFRDDDPTEISFDLYGDAESIVGYFSLSLEKFAIRSSIKQKYKTETVE